MTLPKAKHDPEKPYLRPTDAAERLQCSISTLERLVKAGLLDPPKKLTNRISLYSVESLDRLVDSAPLALYMARDTEVEGLDEFFDDFGGFEERGK